MLYDGEEVDLLPHQEEVATHYALVPLDGPQLGDKETAPTFQANIFEDGEPRLSELAELLTPIIEARLLPYVRAKFGGELGRVEDAYHALAS